MVQVSPNTNGTLVDGTLHYEVTAECPPGKVVIGTGFRTSYITVPAHWIRPIDGGTAVQVVGTPALDDKSRQVLA